MDGVTSGYIGMDYKLTPSFGRRKARKLRDQSQKAYDDLLPFVNIDQPKKPFETLFQDVWLEIGFGGGEHMLEQLTQNPSIAMIGCEPFMNGVAKFLAHLSPKDYQRTRIWHEEMFLRILKLRGCLAFFHATEQVLQRS